MSYSIRLAEESDFMEIIAMFKEFALFEKEPEKMTNTVEQMLEEKDFFNCYLAIDGQGKMVGYATYFLSYHTWVGKCAYMDDLYVKEAHRGEGLGTRLISTIIEKVKSKKCKKLRWQVSNWNEKAQSFYKSIGAEIREGEWNCDFYIK
ncbi:MAG: GNAT family N-acetyltransferase [Reichenbachiella sp.]